MLDSVLGDLDYMLFCDDYKHSHKFLLSLWSQIKLRGFISDKQINALENIKNRKTKKPTLREINLILDKISQRCYEDLYV